MANLSDKLKSVSDPPIDEQWSDGRKLSLRYFSHQNAVQLGRFRVPFPFSTIFIILFIPVLFLAAAISIPVTALQRSARRRRESRIAEHLRPAGRTVRWADVLSEMNQNKGSLIGEYGSPKGPYRLWFTLENIAESSPHPCCFEELPWNEEDLSKFFNWCHARFTDLQSGSARLVEIPLHRDESFSAALEHFGRERRYVTVGPSSSI